MQEALGSVAITSPTAKDVHSHEFDRLHVYVDMRLNMADHEMIGSYVKLTSHKPIAFNMLSIGPTITRLSI